MTVGGGDSDDNGVVMGKCERESSKFSEACGGLSIDELGDVQLAIGGAAADSYGLCLDHICQKETPLHKQAGMTEITKGWDSQSLRSFTIIFWKKTVWTLTIKSEMWWWYPRGFVGSTK